MQRQMMNLTSETFSKALDENAVLIVDFWAEWCGPCRMVAPVLDEIQKEYQVPIAKLNIDEHPELADKYQIRSIPAMIVFENGVPVKTVIGARPKHILVKEFEEWI
jgi:thioredoxin 1